MFILTDPLLKGFINAEAGTVFPLEGTSMTVVFVEFSILARMAACAAKPFTTAGSYSLGRYVIGCCDCASETISRQFGANVLSGMNALLFPPPNDNGPGADGKSS